MSRSHEEETGSLDLLLDTICNAFGGIVFIALLLAVLTREVSTLPVEAYEDGLLPPAVLRLDSEIKMLESEISRLKEHQVEEEEDKKDVSENEQQLTRVAVELLEAQGKEKSAQGEIERLQTELSDNRTKIQEMERKQQSLMALVKRIGEGKRVEKRLPLATSANPNIKQFWIFVVDKKLHLIDSLREGESLHRDVIILEEGIDYLLATVRTADGQLVKQGFEREGKMLEFLRNTSSRQVAVQAVVDKKSFKEFNLVKDVLIQSGYRYFFDIGEPPIRFVRGSDFENF